MGVSFQVYSGFVFSIRIAVGGGSEWVRPARAGQVFSIPGFCSRFEGLWRLSVQCSVFSVQLDVAQRALSSSCVYGGQASRPSVAFLGDGRPARRLANIHPRTKKLYVLLTTYDPPSTGEAPGILPVE
jgi:hypothetical protein